MNQFNGLCILCLNKMKPGTKWMEQENQIVFNYDCEVCKTHFCLVGEAVSTDNSDAIELENDGLKGSWIIPKNKHTDEIF